MALEYMVGGGKCAAFNIGSGKGYSILNVLSTVEEGTGHILQKRFCPRRPGDPPVLVADSRQALQVLHWKPSRSLHDIVTTAWNWMQSPRAKDPVNSCRERGRYFIIRRNWQLAASTARICVPRRRSILFAAPLQRSENREGHVPLGVREVNYALRRHYRPTRTVRE